MTQPDELRAIAEAATVVERLLWHVEQVCGPVSTEPCELPGDDDRSILQHNFTCELAALLDRLTAAEARVVDLKDVLRLFVVQNDGPWTDRWPDDATMSTVRQVTYGQWRRARAALGTPRGPRTWRSVMSETIQQLKAAEDVKINACRHSFARDEFERVYRCSRCEKWYKIVEGTADERS